MISPIRWRDILWEIIPEMILKLAIMLTVIGLPFWCFLTQLAEHGWK